MDSFNLLRTASHYHGYEQFQFHYLHFYLQKYIYGLLLNIGKIQYVINNLLKLIALINYFCYSDKHTIYLLIPKLTQT